MTCVVLPQSTRQAYKMANIHDDAWRGTLTADRLKQYLANANASLIDSPGGDKAVTPLAAACWRGHLDIVRLLLDNPHRLANPNSLSLHNRTALFYATSRSPAKDRCAIVQALLDAGAEIDACSAADDLYTPLMNAIVEVKDKDVIHTLVDHGASLVAKNGRGETAETLAKQFGMERELQPRSKRNSSRAEIIDLIVALVMFIIAVVNSGVIKDVVKGTVSKLYGITGAKDQEIAKDIGEPDTVEGLKTGLDSYVAESGLDKFFAPGDPFLQTLAEKASALRDDPTTSLGSPENIKRLTRLSLYQPVIYCDDSGSMESDNRYEHQCELVSRIARIATKIVPDEFGVELRFINAKPKHEGSMPAAKVEAAMAAVRPNGGTQIGTVLRNKILQPLVYDVLASGHNLTRPLLICVITDGCPSNEGAEEFKKAIVNCRRQLVNGGYEPTAVMFSISQIGNDKQARAFLDGLRGDKEIEDILYCTTDQLDSKLKELRENENRLEEWLLKTLTNPIMGRDEV
ncbi:hypothetical protein AcV5_001948 [Taiwanofungus camphoratus]|nr:hypothetical protein AcV5_001948 [Antrodia cinnamomea]KAI0960705.1 hypothetical protein AcV7_000010 [Antrodia cinnamomea]